MFIRKKPRANGKTSVQVVENHRGGDKINQKIVRHIGQGKTEWEIEELIKIGNFFIAQYKERRAPSLPFNDPEKIEQLSRESQECPDKVAIKDLVEEQRVNVGFSEFFGKLYKDLNLDFLFEETRKGKQWNNIFLSCVLARLANPVSKRRTASLLEEDFGVKIPLEKIYRMMVHLAAQEEQLKGIIRNGTLNLFKQKVELLFYDVTTLYFESFESDELRVSGFSKDAKFKETQIVLALITTENGLPIDYKIFPGNTYEGRTLIGVLKDLQQHYEVRKATLVADRGMFNKKNLDLMDQYGIEYVVGAKLRTLKVEFKNQILEEKDYEIRVVKNEVHWLKEIENNGRRMIIGYSSKRAKKDAYDRAKVVPQFWDHSGSRTGLWV